MQMNHNQSNNTGVGSAVCPICGNETQNTVENGQYHCPMCGSCFSEQQSNNFVNQSEREKEEIDLQRKAEEKKEKKQHRIIVISVVWCSICVIVLALMIPNVRFWIAKGAMNIKQYQIADFLFRTVKDDFEESRVYHQKIEYAEALSLIYEDKLDEANQLLKKTDHQASIIKAEDLKDGILGYARSLYPNDEYSYVYSVYENDRLQIGYSSAYRLIEEGYSMRQERSSTYIEYIYNNTGDCTTIIVITGYTRNASIEVW